jgi:hypothetical protein
MKKMMLKKKQNKLKIPRSVEGISLKCRRDIA